MAESHRRLLTRELEELLAGERETWSPRAVARVASRDARLRRPAATDAAERRRRNHRAYASVTGEDFGAFAALRHFGLVTALALRMRELAPDLLVLREQVDPLASAIRWPRALAFRRAGSGRVAVGIDVGRGDRTTVVVAELRPDGTCRVLDVSTREAP